jgi:hypothetical protein
MKSHWMLAGLAAAGVGLSFVANSQEPAPKAFEKAAEGQAVDEEPDPFDADANAPKLVQTQVEFVEMSHEALTKLLFFAKPKSADATELRKQVQDMVAKNEAKVLETQIVISRSGHKSTSESIHEFIYPTEFDPASVELKMKDTLDKAMLSGFPFNPATPTAFETRNIGSTLEVEPTLGEDNRIIDLRFLPEISCHTGNTVWHEGKDTNGNPFKIAMPDFHILRLNTAITCINGQYTLAGVVSPKDDKGETDMTRKVMIFVKCDVLSVK